MHVGTFEFQIEFGCHRQFEIHGKISHRKLFQKSTLVDIKYCNFYVK